MRTPLRSCLFMMGVIAASLFVGTTSADAGGPPVIDPDYALPNNAGFNAVGDFSDIYMNRNQLLLRITGCEFGARVTNTQNGHSDFFCDDGNDDPRHWRGSGMGFIEEIVNEKLFNATEPVASYYGSDPTSYQHLNITEDCDNDGVKDDTGCTRIFRNYVDLLVKRLLDSDTLTAIDFDQQTFRYVDHFNPSTTLPTSSPSGVTSYLTGPDTVVYDPSGTPSPTTRDTNGDGVEGGWEPEPLLNGTCIAIPAAGDLCLTMYIVNVDERINPYPGYASHLTFAGSPSAVAPATSVSNVGGLMVDFAGFVTDDQFNSSHLFLAGEPKREFSFDAEIDGCDEAELLTDLSGCNDNPVRDDDDGLYIEIKLVDFTLDTLFEPPFTDASLGTSETVRTRGTTRRKSPANQIADIDESGFINALCPDGSVITDPDGDGEEYQPECDLSNYLKATGTVTIPELSLGLSLRVVSEFSTSSTAQTDPVGQAGSKAAVTGSTMTLGLDVKSIEVSAEFFYVLNEGPYCTSNTQGQDFTGIWYDQTANPNNCDVIDPEEDAQGGGPSVLDDYTYETSTRFVTMVSFFRGELDGVFEDFFDPASNPGFFLGPTQLFDINGDLLDDLSIDHPLVATAPAQTTDYIWLQLSLDSNVDKQSADMAAANGADEYMEFLGAADSLRTDGDQVTEFWADPWGVMMPLNAGLGLYWTADENAVTEMVSCVTTDTQLTGYADGYYTGDNSDNPIVSRPLPNLALNWSGSGFAYDGVTSAGGNVAVAPEYDSALLHLKIPNVNGAAPFTQPSFLANNNLLVPEGTDVANEPVTSETYAFGLALHQNLLSKALYEAVIDGLLCLDVDPLLSNVELFQGLEDILTTDTFEFFVPYLGEQFGGMNMAIRAVPLLQDPTTRSFSIQPADGTGEYASKISQFVADFSQGTTTSQPIEDVTDTSAHVTQLQENPIPRIVMGGVNQYDARKKRFRGQIVTESLLQSTANNTTCDSTFTNPLTNPNCGIWPDMSVVVPHLLLEFYVWDDNSSPAVRRRAFALDVGLNIGLNIDVVRDITVGGDSGSQSTLLGDSNLPTESRPVYSGTDFPVGCDSSFASFQCEVEDVPSRLVLFLGGIADPELNAILVYDEMASQITDFTGAVSNATECADPSGDVACDTSNFEAYENSISNLIGLILSGEISAFVEIGIDPAALLNIPIIVEVPYIGPSFVWNDETAVAGQGLVGQGLVDGAGCEGGNGTGNDECLDPVFSAPGNVSRDVSDGDANGFGDYLVVGLGANLDYLDSGFLIRLIDSFVEPLLYPHCSPDSGSAITDIACLSEVFTNPFADLGLGAPGFANTGGELPGWFNAPETIIKGVRKAHALETLIDYEGWHPADDASTLTYSYRVDGGFWTPYVPAKTARIPGLLEGRHVFEVRAKDASGNVEPTVERIEFVVDSVAPRMTILGDRVQSGNVSYMVDVQDARTLPEDIRVSYKLDDGEWSAYSYTKEIALNASNGQHVLRVRAMDEAGNVGESVMTIAVEDGGFGCSVAPSGSNDGLADLIVMLLVPALVVLRRRRR